MHAIFDSSDEASVYFLQRPSFTERFSRWLAQNKNPLMVQRVKNEMEMETAKQAGKKKPVESSTGF